MKPVFIFTVALAVLSTASWAGSGRSSLISSPSLDSTTDTSVVIIDERELLRRYLDEVENRSDAEVRIELARLKLAREMFRERLSWDKEQWRDERDQMKRDRWMRDFGFAYRSGAARAHEIVRQAPGVSGCQALKRAIQTGSSEFPARSLEASAYQQGMAAAYPEFRNSLTERLLTIKFAVEAYSRWEITSNLALPAVNQVKSSYSHVLGMAGSISSRTEVSSLEIRRAIHDRDGGQITLQTRELLGEIPALESHLLGRTASERRQTSLHLRAGEAVGNQLRLLCKREGSSRSVS